MFRTVYCVHCKRDIIVYYNVGMGCWRSMDCQHGL